MNPIIPCLRRIVCLLLPLLAAAWQAAPEPAPDEVDRVLQRLESAHAGIDRFGSPLTYRREYALEGDFETRIGEIALRGTGADREFVIVFDRVIDADGHGTEERRYHVYRDGWWTEVDPGRRRVVARQIQEPGARRDPFELGEGPLPLPIGQRADRVRARFEVSMGEKPDEPLFRALEDPLVLHLVPRTGTPAAEDIESIDLLYDRESLLPLGVRVTDDTGDRTTAWLRAPRADLEDDALLSRVEEARALITRAETDPAWSVQSKPLPAPEDAGGETR